MNKIKVLFQGDSITDAGRDRGNMRNMGNGYPLFAASGFKAENPGAEVDFINLGISGNRVKDLKERWREDCLAIEPDVLSVLIGINDTWRRYDSGDPTSCEDFEDTYGDILEQVKTAMPQTKIIVMEPFVLPTPQDRVLWREDLDPKIHAVRRLAREYADEFIPLDGIMAAAAAVSCPEQWAADGVHPTSDGAALIAKHWLEAFNRIISR